MQLDGKIAIITGAARGQGAAEAARFVSEGARVVVADVLDDEGRSTAEDLGDCAEYHHCDVGDADDWARLVAHVEATHGRIDVLVNNAGISRTGSIDDFLWEDFDAMVRINQRGVLLGMRAVAATMRRARRGSIINIASGAALRGMADLICYTGTKFAVRGMSQAAAAELGSDNIRVNLVHPGCIDTPMHRQSSAKRQQTLLHRIPLGRFGHVTEVADVVVFLASDASTYITGSDFQVDGGFLL